MPRPSHSRNGFSLAELLVVLVIFGVLAAAGIMMIGNRKDTSVRTLMDQVEGTLMVAQKHAMASGQDVTIAVNGTWTGTGAADLSTAGRFVMDPRPFQTPVPAPDPYIGVRVGSDSERLVSLFTQNERDHMHAGVATDNDGNGLTTPLASLTPFNSPTDSSFLTALNSKLCTGSQNRVTVNGVTYRFTSGFCIVVVSLNPDGSVDTNGATGVLVVPQNSANVYRFYRRAGVTTWLRI